MTVLRLAELWVSNIIRNHCLPDLAKGLELEDLETVQAAVPRHP